MTRSSVRSDPLSFGPALCFILRLNDKLKMRTLSRKEDRMNKQSHRIFLALTMAALVFPGAIQAQSTLQWADMVGDEYQVVANLTYSTANNAELKLDLYLPRNTKEPVPVVLYIHGGGWIAGTKEGATLRALPFLALHWAVVNVEYRMARTSLAPAAVEDCRCALQWIMAHAKQYNFNTEKIVVTGASAGGHLALMTGMLPPSSPFDHQCATADSVRWTRGTEPKLKVAAIVNWFGITDVADLLDGPNAKHYAIEWFGSMNNREELAKEVSPLSYVRTGLPPIITIHGDADALVPYSHATRLHQALDKAGVTNQLITIRGGNHGGFEKKETERSYEAVRGFLKKAIGE